MAFFSKSKRTDEARPLCTRCQRERAVLHLMSVSPPENEQGADVWLCEACAKTMRSERPSLN
jgi:protein-arginine kinase activator protein McsA